MNSLDWSYLFGLALEPQFWRAAGVVVILSILAWTTATLVGLIFAVARQWRWAGLKHAVGAYVWLFRSMPLLVLIVLVYNVPIAFPQLKPLLGNPFWAGLIAMVLSETAYITEIHRGAMLSVGKEQHEAAKALGLSYTQTMRRIVIPQAFRIALPSLGNQLVAIVKLTSLVSVISLAELLTMGERLYTQNFKVLETLLGVSMFYVLLVSVFSALQSRLEKRFDVRRRTTELSGAADEDGMSEPVETVRPKARAARHQRPLALKVRTVTKSFGETKALDRINLDVRTGDVIALVGSSGSGKSTLLRTISKLEDRDAGSIDVTGSKNYVGQKGGSRRAHMVGMVFQHFNLFPHLTVLENLMLAPRLHGTRELSDLREHCTRLLRRVGMARYANRYPYQLSGGQQQRVAIARALAMEPAVLLFDEPTSALDPELVGEVLAVMTELAADGTTMIVATHEMRFVRQVADWVVLMEAGTIVEQGPPAEVMATPRDERTAQFFSLENQGV